jgi:hypothetical protein
MDDVVVACPSLSDADAMEIGAVIDAGGLVLAEGIGQDGFDLILATLPVAMVAKASSWVTDPRYGAQLWAAPLQCCNMKVDGPESESDD